MDTPLQDNFKVPVTLKNRIENGPSTDFGSLWANNHEVASGTSEGFRYLTSSNDVQHYTLETEHENERKYSFKWTSANINAVGEQNYFFSNFGFTIPVNPFTKEITRNFKTVWPLKLKNVSIESNSAESFGSIYFKDPTTDNQFHQYPAAGENGFEKNEAFAELDEEVNGQPHQKYSVKTVPSVSHNGRNYYWYSGDFNPNTPTDLLVTSGTTKVANFKGTQLSSQTDAYNTTSQRKFVKTTDGYLHSVYESLGKIWYEVSPDNGATWYIQQDINGNSLPSSSSGKQPAIDWYYYDDQTFGRYEQVVIVWQEKSGSSSKIMCAYFHRIYETPVGKMVLADTEEVSTVTGSYSSTNCTPVLGLNTFLHIIYKNGNNGYMILKRGSVNITSGIILSSSTTLTQAGNYAKNPTIAVNKSGSPNTRVAWEGLGLLNTTDIYSAKFNAFNSQLEEINNISSGNGYPVNYSPCISIANGRPIVSWTGYFDGNIWKITGEQENLIRKRALVKVRGDLGWGSLTELGDNVNFVNNNSATSVAEKTVFVWSQGTSPQSKWIRRDGSSSSNPFSNIGNLSHSGIENQLTSGSEFNNMYAMVFNKQNVPYYFIKSTTNFSQDPIGGGIGKVGSLEQISYGRSGIVNKQGVEFVFNTGDVFVADSSIQFTFVPDTILFNSEQELNTAARTENFWLEEGVDFFFSNLYYVIRQELADSVLTEQDQVNFKVELVRAQSGDVVGTFDNITYSKNNLEKYASINYQVNCSGIQAGEYYLRLATTVAGEAGYNLSNIQRDEFDLNKLHYVNVSFTGEGLPASYDLSQNYPNPFNPTTTIRYQLPKDGMVMLKVYDILGAEVATLVNEEKVAGKYEVNFDASRLASGVYIYRLNVNDFVNVKKMVLLK